MDNGRQYEYLVISIKPIRTTRGIEIWGETNTGTSLAQYGIDRWELVGLIPSLSVEGEVTAFFKRPIPEEKEFTLVLKERVKE